MEMGRYLNPYPEEENGAVYAMKGRFLIPVPKAQQTPSKEFVIPMRIAVAVGLLAVALFVGILWMGIKRAELPYQEVLMQSIGQPQEIVVEALELPDGLLQVSDGVYAIPDGCKYGGISFDVLLYFEENEQLLCAYEYVAEYSTDSNAAAKDISEFLSCFKDFKQPIESRQTLKLEKAELLEAFADSEIFSVKESWDMTDSIGTPVSDYLQHLNEADFWVGRVGEYLTIPAKYYLDVNIEYVPEGQTVSLLVRYAAEPRRTGVLGK